MQNEFFDECILRPCTLIAQVHRTDQFRSALLISLITTLCYTGKPRTAGVLDRV